jgi:hypothetical protein
MSLRRRPVLLLVACAMAAGLASPAAGQSVRVSVPEENFRKEPRVTSSNRLATVFEGGILGVEAQQGRWIRASVEGWIWSQSLEATDRDGFDLIVSVQGGENLREAPAGDARRVARLLRGMLLDRVESQGGWTRVRRTAWIWAESTVETETPSPEAPDEGALVPAARAEDAEPQPAALPDRILISGSDVRLHVSPEGDTLAQLRANTDLEVLARRGSWARVRLEGWVWVPSTLPVDSAAATGDLSPADVVANPDQFQGRQVRWRLQYVSLETAEPARSDFYEGEAFILARAPDGDQGFVYVAVPPELVVEVREIRPLQMIEVLGRVRTGRSALMGVPVVDLITLN